MNYDEDHGGPMPPLDPLLTPLDREHAEVAGWLIGAVVVLAFVFGYVVGAAS